MSDETYDIKSRLDAFVNALSGWGGIADPLRQTIFQAGTTFSKIELETMYRWDWLIRKVIDVIPGDAVRKRINIKMEDKDLSKNITDRLDSLKFWKKSKEAMSLARLYGGAVVIIGAMDNEDVSNPLREDSIKEIKFLNVLDKNQLMVKDKYSDPLSSKYGEPETYKLSVTTTGFMEKVKEMLKGSDVIHETRLLRFSGDRLPPTLREQNGGWDDSIIVAISETSKQYGVSVRAGSMLMMDFVTKVLKIPNLAQLLQNKEWSYIQTRIQYAMANMSTVGITLIGQDEEFNKMQNPVAGLVQIMDKYIEIMSAATGIPRSRLFGQQLGKLAGATETTRSYYDVVSDYQEDNLSEPIDRILYLLLKDPTITKKPPDDWTWEFNSLWQEDPKTQAETRKYQMETDCGYIDRQVLTAEEVAISRFGSGEWNPETTLDMETREVFKEGPDLNEPEPEPEEEIIE